MTSTVDRRTAESLRLVVYGQYRTLDPDLALEAANLIDGLLDDVGRLTAECDALSRGLRLREDQEHYATMEAWKARDAARRWAAVWKYVAKKHRWYFRATFDLLVKRSQWAGPPRNTPAASTYTPLPHVEDDSTHTPFVAKRTAFTTTTEAAHGVEV